VASNKHNPSHPLRIKDGRKEAHTGPCQVFLRTCLVDIGSFPHLMQHQDKEKSLKIQFFFFI